MLLEKCRSLLDSQMSNTYRNGRPFNVLDIPESVAHVFTL